MMMRRLQHLMVVSLFAIAVGCSDDDKDHDRDDDTDTPAIVLSIAAGTPNVTMTLGEQEDIAVAITRPPSLEGQALVLTATGLPAGVTASFDDASPTGNSATLTLAATQDAVLGSSVIKLTALTGSSTSGSASADIALSIALPAPITITGKVIASNSLVAAGAVVRVLGHRAGAIQTTTADALGNFTFTNVVPPYDASIWITPGTTDPVTTVFLDQTSTTPTFGLFFVGGGLTPSTMPFSFTVTGATDGDRAVLGVDCASGTGNGTATVAAGSAAITGNAPAPAGATVACIGRAVTQTLVGGHATAYTGYGETTSTFTAAGPNSISTAVTGPIASRVINATARNAAGAVASQVDVNWFFGDHGTTSLDSYSSLTAAQDIRVPTDDRVTTVVGLQSFAGVGGVFAVFKRITPTVSAIDVTVPNAPLFQSPGNGATGVDDSTVFAMGALEGGTHLYIFQASPHTVVVNTGTATSFSAARLRPLSAALHPGTTYTTQAATLVVPGITDPLAPERTTIIAFGRIDGATLLVSPGTIETAP